MIRKIARGLIGLTGIFLFGIAAYGVCLLAIEFWIASAGEVGGVRNFLVFMAFDCLAVAAMFASVTPLHFFRLAAGRPNFVEDILHWGGLNG